MKDISLIDRFDGYFKLDNEDCYFVDYGKNQISEKLNIRDMIIEVYTKNQSLIYKLREVIDSNIISKYGVDIVRTLGYVPEEFKDTKELYDSFIESKEYGYAIEFSKFEDELYDNEELEDEVEVYVTSLIDTYKELPSKYKNSSLFFYYTIEKKRFDLLNYFSKEIFDIYEASYYAPYYEEILNNLDITNLPSVLINKSDFLELLITKNGVNALYVQNDYIKNEEVISKYAEEIIKYINEYGVVPFPLIYNRSLFERFVLENSDKIKVNDEETIKLLFEFDSSVVTKKIVDEYPNIVDECLKRNNSFHYDDLYIPFTIRDNKIILIDMLNKGEYEKALRDFNENLFTADILDNYPIVDIISSSFTYYYKLAGSHDLFKKMIESDKYLTYKYHFYDSVINYYADKYYDRIVAVMESGNDITTTFYQSEIILEKALEKKNYSLLSSFYENTFTENIVSKYGEDLVKYYRDTKDEFLIRPYARSEAFINYCINNNHFDVIANNSELPLNTIKENIDTYAKYCTSIDNDELSNNVEVMNLLIEKKAFILVAQFKCLTDDIIDKYKEEFFNVLLQVRNISSYKYKKLLSSATLLEYGLATNKSGKQMFLFRTEIITKEITVKYLDRIIEIIKEEKENPFILSSFVLEECLKRKKFDVLSNFVSYSYKEEFYEKYLDVFMEMSYKEFPRVLSGSTKFLVYCIDNGLSKYIDQFSSTAIDSLSDEYLSKIVEGLSVEMPYQFAKSKRLFEYMMSINNFDYFEQFSDKIFGADDFYQWVFFEINNSDRYEIIEKYYDKIINHFGNYIPTNLRNNEFLFTKYVEADDYRHIMLFSKECFESHNIDKGKVIEIIKKGGVVPPAIVSSTLYRNLILDKGDTDLLIQFAIMSDNPEIIKSYASLLDMSVEEISNKISKLKEVNDEILNTLTPAMLSKKMSHLSLNQLERIAIYPELEYQFNSLNEKEIIVISKILDYIDNTVYDLSGVLVRILNNIDIYKGLLNEIEVDNINYSNIKNLINTLCSHDNAYNINSVEDLNNYVEHSNNYFKKIESSIKNNAITVNDLKAALFKKKYCLEMDQVKFIYKRYCHNLDSQQLDPSVKNILKSIELLYNCNNIDELKFHFIITRKTNLSSLSSISLEAEIRKSYADLYSKTLYQPKEEHLYNEDNYSEEINTLINSTHYNDIKPKIYVVDGDFNMQIHALGAYRDWSRPSNFKDDWERPKIAYHGICTSYIGNNQIANARASHAIYGFSNYEASALLVAGNYDLCSDRVIERYDTASVIPYDFYTPSEMINQTRHTHNEMVLERRGDNNGKSFKRTPDYVVYPVDDINNPNNFSSENLRYQETVQAAVDNDIPIVIVDRLKYAKSEKNKCDKLINGFFETLDYSLISEYVLAYCNNMIGCTKFDLNDNAEYYDYFNIVDFTKQIENIISRISTLDTNVATLALNTLYTSLEKEKDKGSKIPDIDFNKQLEKNETKEENIDDMMTFISTYYYFEATEEEQNLISDYLVDGVEISEIVNMIKESNLVKGAKL